MNCHRMKTWCLHVKFDDIPKTFGDSDDVQDNTMIMMTMMPAVWTVRGGQWLNAYVWCMLMSYRSVNSDLRFKITREIYRKRKICNDIFWNIECESLHYMWEKMFIKREQDEHGPIWKVPFIWSIYENDKGLDWRLHNVWDY